MRKVFSVVIVMLLMAIFTTSSSAASKNSASGIFRVCSFLPIPASADSIVEAAQKMPGGFWVQASGKDSPIIADITGSIAGVISTTSRESSTAMASLTTADGLTTKWQLKGGLGHHEVELGGHRFDFWLFLRSEGDACILIPYSELN